MSSAQQKQIMGANQPSHNRSISPEEFQRLLGAHWQRMSPEERQNMIRAQWQQVPYDHIIFLEQQQRIMKVREQQIQTLMVKQRERSRGQPSLVGVMETGARWYELPFEEPSDLHWLPGEKPQYIISLEKACQAGSAPDIQTVINSNHLSTIKLYKALLITLNTGHIDASAYLLENGARTLGSTARNILSAPVASQIPVFDLLIQHGWDINKAEDQKPFFFRIYR